MMDSEDRTNAFEKTSITPRCGTKIAGPFFVKAKTV
jgi:hypothetical protein